MEITYSSIKSYILEERLDKSYMVCKFKVEGQVFESKGTIRPNSNDGAGRVQRMVKMTAIGRLRSSVLSVLRRAVGGGFAGTVASMAGTEIVRQQTEGTHHTRKDKEAAVVDAFIKIKHEFYYENGKWKVAKTLSEFEKLIEQKPLTSSYDKKILARMLVEMARADSVIEDEEKEFFNAFLDAETGSLGELMREPNVSIVECEEVSKDTKENIFMITAAVALTDHEFAEEEKDKLEEYADMLGLDDDKRAKLLQLAQDYTIESYIKANEREMTRDEIYAFADNIGMDRGEAERAQIKMSKRLNE